MNWVKEMRNVLESSDEDAELSHKLRCFVNAKRRLLNTAIEQKILHHERHDALTELEAHF